MRRVAGSALGIALSVVNGCGTSPLGKSDAAWTAPRKLAENGQAASVEAEIAAAAGRVVAIWCGRDDGIAMMAREHTVSSGWSTPVRLPFVEPGTVAVRNLRFRMDRFGNGFATWVEYSTDQARVVAARYESRGGWAPPRLLDRQASDGRAFTLSLDVDPDGNAVLGWIGNDALHAYSWTRERDWVPIVTARPSLGLRLEAVTVGLSGSAVVVSWRDARIREGAVVSRFLDLEAGWSEDAAVPVLDGASRPMGVAVDGNGSAVVLVDDLFTGTRSLEYRAGAGWQEPASLGPDSLLALKRDGGDRFIAVLTSRDDPALVARHWTSAGGWASPEALGRLPSNAQVDVDPQGGSRFIAGSILRDRAWMARSQGGPWQSGLVPDSPREPAPWDCEYDGSCFLWIRVATDRTGDSWLMWQQRDGPQHSVLWVRRLLAGS
jgi:hypothetical protein